MKNLEETREIYKFKNVWTSDGKILFKDGSGNINLFFMISPNLGSNGQGLLYGKRNEKGRKKLFYSFLNFDGLDKLLLFLQ